MNQIEQLIAQRCPNGVFYRALNDVLQYEQPTKYLVKSADYSDDAPTPVLTAGQTFVLGHTFEETGVYKASRERPVIIFDDFTTSFKWVDFPFKAKSSAMKLITARDGSALQLRYLFYLMQTIRYVPHEHARQWIGFYSKFRVPIPPIEVQQAIVDILDKFTKLEAELEAELEARKQQYGYFAALLMEPQGAEKSAKLGDLASIVRGASPRPIRSFLTDDESGIPWIKIGDVPSDGKFVTGAVQRITQSGAQRSRFVHPGDFILSNSMSFGRPYISRITGCIHDGWLVISDFEENFRPDYLYYLLRSMPVQKEFNRRAGSGTVKNLNADIVKSVSVHVPPIKEQDRVVKLLDQFDSLVNDLSFGLPAEIAARRKQYEYYRDELLTFKELVA